MFDQKRQECVCDKKITHLWVLCRRRAQDRTRGWPAPACRSRRVSGMRHLPPYLPRLSIRVDLSLLTVWLECWAVWSPLTFSTPLACIPPRHSREGAEAFPSVLCIRSPFSGVEILTDALYCSLFTSVSSRGCNNSILRMKSTFTNPLHLSSPMSAWASLYRIVPRRCNFWSGVDQCLALVTGSASRLCQCAPTFGSPGEINNLNLNMISKNEQIALIICEFIELLRFLNITSL